jgi:hypothetical protein
MRYRLRTLLILMAVVPPAVAGVVALATTHTEVADFLYQWACFTAVVACLVLIVRVLQPRKY